MEAAPFVALLRYPSPFGLVDGGEWQGELKTTKEPPLGRREAPGRHWGIRGKSQQRFLATGQRELPRWPEEVLRWMLDRGVGPV